MTTHRAIRTILIAAGSLLAAVGLARADGEVRQSYDPGGDRDGRSAQPAQRDWYERGAMQSPGQWSEGWRGDRDDSARFGFNVNLGWSPYYYYGPNVYAYQGYRPAYPAYGYSYPAQGPSYPAYGYAYPGYPSGYSAYGYSAQPSYGSSYSGYGSGYPAYAPPAWPQGQGGYYAAPPYRGKCLEAYNQGYHDGYAAGCGASPGYYNYRH